MTVGLDKAVIQVINLLYPGFLKPIIKLYIGSSNQLTLSVSIKLTHNTNNKIKL